MHYDQPRLYDIPADTGRVLKIPTGNIYLPKTIRRIEISDRLSALKISLTA